MFWYENISDLTAIPLFPIIFIVTCNWLNKAPFLGCHCIMNNLLMKTTVILIIKREIIHNKIPYIQSFTWFIFIVPRSKICYIKNVLYSIFITGCNIAIFLIKKVTCMVHLATLVRVTMLYEC